MNKKPIDTTSDSPTTKNLLKTVIDQGCRLAQLEISIAKQEIKSNATKISISVALFIFGIALGTLAIVLLFITIILLLSLIMPSWLATLCVTLCAALSAIICFYVGKKLAKKGSPIIPKSVSDSWKSSLNVLKKESNKLNGK